MKKKLIAASVFVFGLGLGSASAGTFSSNPATGPSSISPEQAQCISECQAAGGEYRACWNCCVSNICAVD